MSLPDSTEEPQEQKEPETRGQTGHRPKCAINCQRDDQNAPPSSAISQIPPNITAHHHPCRRKQRLTRYLLLSSMRVKSHGYISSFNHWVGYDSAVFRHVIRQPNRERTAILTWFNNLFDKNEKLIFDGPCLTCSLSLQNLAFYHFLNMNESQMPTFLFLKCNTIRYLVRKSNKKESSTDNNQGICWRWGAPCRPRSAGGHSVPWAGGTTHTGSPQHRWRSPSRRRPTAANGRAQTLQTDRNMRIADHCIWTHISN